MHDLLLRDVMIVDPESDRVRQGDIAVEDGKFVEPTGSARTVVRCYGLHAQPGIIDTHVHLAIQPASYAMVARAGVTTALDMAGPAEGLLDDFARARVGINVGTLNAVLPGRNLSGNDAAKGEFLDFITASRRAGALGVKLLGGHFPLTPEASARMVEAADEMRCYMAWHAGTTAHGSDIEGLLELGEIAGGHPLHLPHLNAYCRGRVHSVLEECALAEKLILAHPEFTTESYLSARNGAPLNCDAAGNPLSAITRGTLARFGFAPTALGIEDAVRAGVLAVLHPSVDDVTLLGGEAGVAYFREHREKVDGSFDGVNPLLSRAFFATQKRPDGTFLVDAVSTDGGGIPQNVILENGLQLVSLGAMTPVEFARKTSLNPARMLGLTTKGGLRPGMDADLTLYDPVVRRAVHTLVGGRFVLHSGVVQHAPGTLLTTAEGREAALRRNLEARILPGIVPALH